MDILKSHRNPASKAPKTFTLHKFSHNLYVKFNLFALLFALFQLTPGALSFFIDERQSPSAHQWSYSSQHEWPLGHRQCGKNAQSPIDIQRRYVIQNNQLRLHFYNYNQLTRFKIQNAHHTIKLNPIDSLHQQQQDQFGLKLHPTGGDGGLNSSFPDILTADEDSELSEFESRPTTNQQHHVGREQSRISIHQQPNNDRNNGHSGGVNTLEEYHHQQQANEMPPYGGAPAIKLDWLDDGNNEYKLRDIHFHWGDRRDNGSEHAIDGRRAAMEMHLVHIKHGLDKSKIGFTSDSVTVIAVLIESQRKSNADFNPIVNALTRINMTNQAQEIEYKSINDLLPSILTSFYTYSGSLTTPPCYQVVNWIVMSDRLYLNAKQIEMFRNLYAPAEGGVRHDPESDHGMEPALIMPNIRQIQPINYRTILASFAPLSRLEQIQVAHSPYNGAATTGFNNIHSIGSILCVVALIHFATNMLVTTKH